LAMDVLAWTIADWDACGPVGGGLSTDSLPMILDLAANRVLDSSAPPQLQQAAYVLLEPEAGEAMGDHGQPALLERMLLRGRPAAHECGHTSGDGSMRINFLRFWQAWWELWTRLADVNEQSVPVIDELAIFRDALLRRSSATECSLDALGEEVANACRLSIDPAAWAPLEESMGMLRDADCGGMRFSFFQADECAPHVLSMLSVCELVLLWMRGVVQDYRIGPRSAKIRAVTDVCGCSPREACLQLARNAWDVEAAMMSYYGHGGRVGGCGPPPLAQGPDEALSWSSHGAKLRRSEVECPICAEPYADGVKPVVSSCCFQVLCQGCHDRMLRPSDDSTPWRCSLDFQCPFCRGVQRHGPAKTSQAMPMPGGLPLRASSATARRFTGVGDLLRAAGEVGRSIVDITAAFRDDPREAAHGDSDAVAEDYNRRQQLRQAAQRMRARAVAP